MGDFGGMIQPKEVACYRVMKAKCLLANGRRAKPMDWAGMLAKFTPLCIGVSGRMMYKMGKERKRGGKEPYTLGNSYRGESMDTAFVSGKMVLTTLDSGSSMRCTDLDTSWV